MVIEHNLDVIKTADHIVDLGPEGGDGGGTLWPRARPEEVAEVPASFTRPISEASAGVTLGKAAGRGPKAAPCVPGPSGERSMNGLRIV